MADSAPTYVPFAERPGFSDLTPIPQQDAPNCLVPIAYAPKYRDAMDIFRALVAKGEKSARGLDVTEVLIRLNPGHYSIWAYRAQILLETQADLTKELDLMDELVKEHLKSYQVWQHRRTVVTALSLSTRELPFTTKALSYDAKNYHTWAYRQWALLHFFSSPKDAEIWQGELRYTESLLGDDLRNNSAWNHRYFVCFESGMLVRKEEVVKTELEFTKEKINLSPNNPSAWNYLRGLLKATSTPLSSLISFVTPLTEPHIIPISLDSPISPAADLPATLAIEFLADAKSEEKKVEEAVKLFESLEECDPIRKKYWKFRIRQTEDSAKTVPVAASEIPRAPRSGAVGVPRTQHGPAR